MRVLQLKTVLWCQQCKYFGFCFHSNESVIAQQCKQAVIDFHSNEIVDRLQLVQGDRLRGTVMLEHTAVKHMR
jgi:hypothetical protein